MNDVMGLVECRYKFTWSSKDMMWASKDMARIGGKDHMARYSPETEKCIQESIIDVSNVRRWMKSFRNGETSLDDKPRSGRSSTNPENEDKVDELIRNDREITLREL
ncbi:hypothetical protein LAZ67_12000576 [Cordylochernes scorpioides]|uniref:Uncharacterized protein n=1 Tax=Cordylochernes scorpioides TaxID=51811 RepID=A0ABY6L4K0_9ARAC|nr:hypothetical protein LAZ67_12000576 [Cordylochernes scorpioides]